MKKLLLITLAVLMVLGCFVSCSQKTSDIVELPSELTSDTTEQVTEIDDTESTETESAETENESTETESESTEVTLESTEVTTDTESDTEPETESDTESDTESVETEAPEFNLVDDGSSSYKIITPNKCSTAVTNLAKTLSSSIKTATGVSITNMSDSLMGATGPVILLGDTKHPESAQAKAELTEDYSFIIKVFEGNRIAICATEEGLLHEAVQYFIDNYVSESTDTISIPVDLVYQETIEFENSDKSILLTINGSTKYGIVYSSNIDLKTKKIIERFAYQLKKSTGAQFNLYKDDSKAAEDVDYEIVIGSTNRPNIATVSSTASKWKAVVGDGKIYINGSTVPLLADALNSFVYQIIQYEDSLSYVSKNLYRTGGSSNYGREGWEIAAPAYEGGTLATNAYNSSTGRYNANNWNESSMELVSGTNKTEFEAYIAKLESNGYKQVRKTTIDNNIHVQYKKGYSLIYAYYNNYFKEARIIDDCASVSEDEFEYTYTVGADDTVDIIQYAIMCDPSGKGGEAELWPTNGMFYIIKLADNSVVLIDGGDGDQATNDAADALYTYLRKITGVPETEKIRIAALYYTHPHGDHVNLSPMLISRHGNKFDVERLMCNFPSEDAPLVDDAPSGTIISFIGSLTSKYPNIKMVQLHTGQQIELGGAQFNVLYTQEDSVSATTGTASYTAVNNYCTVLSVDYKGVRTMFLGDVANANSGEGDKIINRLTNTYSDSTFKSKIVQVAHHGLNKMPAVYNKIKGEYALYSTTDVKDPTTSAWGSSSRRTSVYNSLIDSGVNKNKILFQSRKTWNLSIDNSGKITVTYTDIDGVDSTYWTETNKYKPYTYSTTYKKTF